MEENDYSEMTIDELEELYKKSLIKSLSPTDEQPNPDVVSKIPKVTEASFGNSDGNYDFDGWYEKQTMFNYSDSDSGCETIVSSWSPADTYAAVVWQQVMGEGDLFRICVKGINIDAGDGLQCQIRTIGSYGAPTEAASCECVSCVSAPLDTYQLDIKQYGLVTELCGKDIFDIGEKYPRAAAKAMGLSYVKLFDSLIWAAVRGASPTVSVDLAATLVCTPSIVSTECCSDASLLNFYNAFNQAIADMREDQYKPDWMVLSPSVAAILKRMQQPAVQAWANQIIKIDADGKLASFNGIKCIEYWAATACSTATDTVFAVIVDSKRAVGAAFGERPRLEKDRNIECNSWTYAMWCYFACATLDSNAIAHIKSPDS